MARIAFYSHDTFGLGHLSRCLKIARILSDALPRINGVLITGSPGASLVSVPDAFRIARLPCVTKCRDGGYRSRARGVALEAVVAERRRRILNVVTSLRPDLFVVDNVPTGLCNEALPALRRCARDKVRCVLALRDVLDGSETVRDEWQRPDAREALDIYDEIWVFGDEADTRRIVRDAGLTETESKVVVCGAIGDAQQLTRPARSAGGRPRILVTGGGGGDANLIVRDYIEALRRFTPAVSSRIVLGPDFDSRAFAEMTAHNGFDATFQRFVPGLAGDLAAADVVVSMAGYNTVCELRTAGCRSVLVPRIRPRREQWLRARRLAPSRHRRVLHPEASDPSSLWSAVEELIETPRPAPELLPGGANVVDRVARFIGAERAATPEPMTVH